MKWTSWMCCFVVGADLLILCSLGFAQDLSENQPAFEMMRADIDSIVQRSALPIRLNKPSETPTITNAQIIISADDIQKIREYGERAVPLLSRYLLAASPRMERVAIRLLAAVGGDGIVEPLTKILRDSPRAGSREEAIRALDAAPCIPSAARAIKSAAEDDPNTAVRTLAQKELSRCPL